MPTSQDQHGLKSEGLANALCVRLFAPVDIASLVAYRIGFGLMMAGWAIHYVLTDRVGQVYVRPRFHFTYYGFDWVQPWPGGLMYVHFIALALLGLAVAAGLCYRASTVMLTLGFVYVFLLDRTNYQNHYYLMALISGAMTILPAHRAASMDVFHKLVTPSRTTPAWTVWLLRFHIALPYFFGGIAKLDADWLAGEPMRQHLREHPLIAGYAPFMSSNLGVGVIVWGGLLFDLLIVPLLLWRRTRLLAYVLCMGFHLTNALLFRIHVFPWFMIVATTIFFVPDWPRRLLGKRTTAASSIARPPVQTAFSSSQRLCVAALGLYCLFHLFWPLRHFTYGGHTNWTDRGHYFAWRMMLREKASGIRYTMTDPQTGSTWHPDIRLAINDEQSNRFVRDPEMILHMAHFLCETYAAATGKRAEVRALVLTSLNGRKPQLLIDPEVDLAAQPRGCHARAWIVPLREPLRAEAWRVPLHDWEHHVATTLNGSAPPADSRNAGMSIESP